MNLGNNSAISQREEFKKLGFSITDEQITGFVKLNMSHMCLKSNGDENEDIDLLSWITKKKFLMSIFLLSSLSLVNIEKPDVICYIKNIVNENSPRIEQPQKFTGKLFPPQASIIKRMLENEENCVRVPKTDKNNEYEFNSGLVSERLSFGKTFCLPALICEQQIPLSKDRISKYFPDNEIIPTNLVMCGTKVAKEWKNNLKKFTSLDFIVVERANHLTELAALIQKDNYPDVIVVKDGDITWNSKKDKAVIHVIELLNEKVFARVILDDYDMLKYPKNFIIPETLFYWLVSGTGECHINMSCYAFMNDQFTTLSLTSMITLLDALVSISCNKEYSSVEYNVPKINCYNIFPEKLENLVENIISNSIGLIEDKCELDTSQLLAGTLDVPYVYNKQTTKIMVALFDKTKQNELVNSLNCRGIKTVKLTRANVDKFEREDATVCVCGNLYGVNMGFLSHIIINVNDFSFDERVQIIGRGQRLSRKQNLQVYFAHLEDDYSSRESDDT